MDPYGLDEVGLLASPTSAHDRQQAGVPVEQLVRRLQEERKTLNCERAEQSLDKVGRKLYDSV